MMELTDDFIKLLQIAFLVVGSLSIFMIFINYNFTVYSNEAEREVFILGDALLSSKCLTVTYHDKPVKALFSQDKLDTLNPLCIEYPKGKINIDLLDNSMNWEITLSAPSEDEKVSFDVVVKLNSGDIKPAKMTVSI